MRDPGLSEAIRAAGSVSELARQIGISQPSVSNWIRVPAERVVSIEAATGVDRAVLRPDLYNGQKMAGDMDEVDAARAQIFALLAALLLLRSGRRSAVANFPVARRCVAARSRARCTRPGAAEQAKAERVEREFFDLFIGLGRGELLPYGSYYLTGFLHDRPLARLREDLAKIGVARAEGVVEPPPHAGILCEIMSGLASRRLPAPPEFPIVSFSTSTWRRGSRVSSLTWRMRRRRISTGGWARSAASSWTSERKPSRCRPRARHRIKNDWTNSRRKRR